MKGICARVYPQSRVVPGSWHRGIQEHGVAARIIVSLASTRKALWTGAGLGGLVLLRDIRRVVVVVAALEPPGAFALGEDVVCHLEKHSVAHNVATTSWIDGFAAVSAGTFTHSGKLVRVWRDPLRALVRRYCTESLSSPCGVIDLTPRVPRAQSSRANFHERFLS